MSRRSNPDPRGNPSDRSDPSVENPQQMPPHVPELSPLRDPEPPQVEIDVPDRGAPDES
jgi:hypothetical protein